jgi:hypothetical protein
MGTGRELTLLTVTVVIIKIYKKIKNKNILMITTGTVSNVSSPPMPIFHVFTCILLF